MASAFIIFLAVTILTVAVLEIYSHRAKIPPVPTLPHVKKRIIAALERHMPQETEGSFIIYELGAGWGGLSIALAKTFPAAHIKAYEISPLPLWVAKLRNHLYGIKNLSFYSDNFFDISLDDANAIVFYLSPWHSRKLAEKFSKDLKPGTIIISNAFPLPGWTPIETETLHFALEKNIFIYRVA